MGAAERICATHQGLLRKYAAAWHDDAAVVRALWIIAFLAIPVTLVVISWLKGRWWAVFLAFLPIAWIVLAVLAVLRGKPGSWWARRYQGE